MKLCGTIENDVTYELKHNKESCNTKRKARHVCESFKYRGLSHEQICSVTTIDRNTHELFKAIGSGKSTTISVLENFSEQIVPNSIIYTDGTFCYVEIAKS